jgi:hypothetical protein
MDNRSLIKYYRFNILIDQNHIFYLKTAKMQSIKKLE